VETPVSRVMHAFCFTWLQWGHVVTDVETREVNADVKDSIKASMGPRRYRRGDNIIVAADPSHERFASMGPRRYRRGDFPVRASHHPHSIASMGPRPYRRGDV